MSGSKIEILFRQRHSFGFCFQVWLCACWCPVSRCAPQTERASSFSSFSWPLTCICFCGCDVWVTAGIAFSRGPRALSLPSELIIYSIYKTLYVQNRKICRRNRAHGRRSDVVKQFFFPFKNTHTHAQFIYHVVTTAPEYCPYCSWVEGNAWLIPGSCVAGAANRLLHNREHWLASWRSQDTQLARWQSSFAENLGQGGRSTQCPLTNSTDHGVWSSTNTVQPHPVSPQTARYVAAKKNTHAHRVLGY